MSIADKMNKESTKDLFEDINNNYTYVMISTLNQMVNYIPLQHFKFKEIYNVTIRDSHYADNEKWDKTLKKELGDSIAIENVEFIQKEVGDINIIINRLKQHLKGKNKIFWNITGGQRPFVLAVNQLAKEDDIICYLEGNKNKMMLLKNNSELHGIVEDYSLDNLKIETALNLMGFDVKETKTSSVNLVEENNAQEKAFYLTFLERYKNSKELRENLILLNKKDKKNKREAEIKKSILNSVKDLYYSEFKNDLNRENAFGYILEKLAGYKIFELAKDKIANLSLSVKINFNENKVSEHHIDEFDIALLTKNGKFMIFECKSGDMTGDVAKSTKYSTYAVGGAYGLPVLITPLLREEIDTLDKLNDSYSIIKKSVKAAKRASLDVWGLDDVEEKLKKYIDI
jgi:hypothetical protein